MSKTAKVYPGIRFREGNNAIDKQGRYVCQIDFYPYANKRVYKTIKLAKKSYREAAQIRAQWMSEYIKKHPHRGLEAKNEISFKDLRVVLEQMMRSSTLNNRAEPCAYSTINKTLNIYDRFFLKYLGECYPSVKHIHHLPKGVFLDYLAYNKQHQKLNWRTELGHLKAIISRLWRSDYCDDRIHKEIRTLPTPKFEIRNKTVLSLEERKAILQAIEKDNYEYFVITYLIAKLGWRVGEVLSLKKKLIHWENGTPVAITIEKEYRKNRKEFTLWTMDRKLANVITNYFNQLNGKSEFLFPNSKGNKIKKETYRNYLHRISEAVIGRRANPHEFRHSLITHLKSMRVPNKDIMQITGHMDERVLNDHYSHSTESGRQEALKLSGI
ncbi:MAG: site-specific integrase [Desulfobacterales bacterium]|nr:site-specific integrase [Desulfobacterales bacterium]